MPTLVLDYKQMRQTMNAPFEYFLGLGAVHVNEQGKQYIFIDNKSDILAVAHLDSVNPSSHFAVVTTKNGTGESRIFSSVVDDRLGAHIILDLLPQHGVKADILLTTDEETGNSTAKFFKTEKKYNWMFSFDRHGTDVVHYRYSEIRKYLEVAGFKSHEISAGAMSDIDYLHELGCLGANFGTGYHDEHNHWAYAVPDEILLNVRRFLNFYHQYKYQHLEYKPISYQTNYQDSYKDWRGNYYPGFSNGWKTNGTGTSTKSNLVPCKFCTSMINPKTNRKYKGVCYGCEIHTEKCMGCSKLFDKRKSTNAFICQKCLDYIADHRGDHHTGFECPECSSRLWLSELVKHTCDNCGVQFTLRG